jgi:predicted nucleic acid-binding protein
MPDDRNVKRVFWDTNVLLDILLRREPFFAPAADVWLRTEVGALEGCVSIPSLVTISYVVRRCADRKTARTALQTICRVFRIVDSPAEVAGLALQSGWKDFEDAVQYHTAALAGADCVMTRNPRDFLRAGEGRPGILTPEEFLRSLA